MSRTSRPALLLAVLAALALGAGCTTTVSGTASPSGTAESPAATSSPARATDAVAWTDDVCGALVPFVQTVSKQPDFASASEPAQIVTGFSQYLGSAITSVDGAITGLRDAGPSPVAGGDEVVRRLTETLGTFRSTFQESKTKVDALDTSDPSALVSGLPAAVAPLEQLSSIEDPTADLQATPELDRASESAANCQELDRLSN